MTEKDDVMLVLVWSEINPSSGTVLQTQIAQHCVDQEWATPPGEFGLCPNLAGEYDKNVGYGDFDKRSKAGGG